MKEINVQSANDLFDLLVEYGGKVVNTGTLPTIDINQAWASKRIWVRPEGEGEFGMGFVWIPTFKNPFPESVEEVEMFKKCYPLDGEPNTLTNSFADKQSQIIQKEYERKMAEKKSSIPTKWFSTEQIETSIDDLEIREATGYENVSRAKLIVMHQCGENKQELISQLKTMIYKLENGSDAFGC